MLCYAMLCWEGHVLSLSCTALVMYLAFMLCTSSSFVDAGCFVSVMPKYAKLDGSSRIGTLYFGWLVLVLMLVLVGLLGGGTSGGMLHSINIKSPILP